MSSRPSKRRYHALDGLRGIFAILVMALHFFGSSFGWKSFPFGDGYLAVDFFFLLSGFVLCHVYERGLQNGQIPLAQFVSHRLVRMYPLHLLTMLAAGCIDYLYWGKLPYIDGAMWTGLLNVLLLQTTGLAEAWSWNAASWSISGEFWIGMLVLPIAFQRARTELLVLAAYAGYFYLYHNIHTLHEPPYRVLSIGISIGILRAASGILLGVAVYRITRALRSTIADPNRFRITAGFLELAILTGLIFVTHSDWRGNVEFAALFSMPFLIYSVSMSQSWMVKLLSTWPMRWLGEISYSVYLIHFPMITLGVYLGMMKITNPFVRFAIFAPIVLALATLIFNIFERPIYRRFRDALIPARDKSRLESQTSTSAPPLR
ncbi:acyltransferase [Paraburkholderia sp. DHOC27]|uniref:acyltransferase family protein n=1 Tax=Paraburkholderia sp. DHOC27 TaxID=2303330 RepID=UPI000E3D4220|nr:acyltransferase [Paraburkholderia sp. DHOC27]RFU45989.1 acyltransferase [Paraburkholderia sp. DHOC27]